MTSYRNSDPHPQIMQGSPPSLSPPFLEWDRAPWNRWTFQHVREVLPTAEVWRGSGPVRNFARAEHDLDQLAVTSSEGKPTTLAGLLDETYTDAFLVIKNGKIAYERYFNGMNERSLHLAQSVTKSFTSAVVGILVSRGVMNTMALVTDYLPELKDTAYKGATLQHILDMTSGVHFSEDYTDLYSEMGQLDVASGWKPVPPGADPNFQWPPHVFEQVKNLKQLDYEHGTKFTYRSIETDVLAFCMERATGRRLPQLMSEELWQKLGMEESANLTVDPAGYAVASGGLNATLRDYGRFGQMLLEGGAGIVPPAWIETSRDGNHALFGAPYTFSLPEGAYHNQFWIENPRSRSVLARGVFGQMIFVDWESQLVAVKLSTWPDFLNTAYSIATTAAIHKIAAAL